MVDLPGALLYWRRAAEALAWPEDQLQEIDAWLKTSRYPVAICAVRADQIVSVWRVDPLYESGHWIGHSTFDRKPADAPYAVPTAPTSTRGAPWCPAHGMGCDPQPAPPDDPYGYHGRCGAHGIVEFVRCRCPWYRNKGPNEKWRVHHSSTCEAFLRIRQEEKDAELAKKRAREEEAAAAHREAPHKPEAPARRRKGDPLPGQAKLFGG